MRENVIYVKLHTTCTSIIYFLVEEIENSQKNMDVWVYLCGEHHNLGNYCVHKNRELDLKLKKECQEEFERQNSHEEYMSIFGKNYI